MDIRPLAPTDFQGFRAIEEKEWKSRDIETVPEEVFLRWVAQGLFLGAFSGERMMGYLYAERIGFNAVTPLTGDILLALEDYKRTVPREDGNALHGVSMASIVPGAGEPLLQEAIRYAKHLGLSYFVSLARLRGFGRFWEENREALRGVNEYKAAALYAIQAVGFVGPDLTGGYIVKMEARQGFPKLRRKDPTVSRFARLGKQVWAVTRTSFADPESRNFSALMVLPL